MPNLLPPDMQPVRCTCQANLGTCRPSQSQNLCPASTYRLLHDTRAAMKEIFDATDNDEDTHR